MRRTVTERPYPRPARHRQQAGGLGRYLSDHLAGADAACAMIDRLCQEHREDPLGAFFAELGADVRADREVVVSLARAVQGHAAPMRRTAGRLAEKFSRIKPGTTRTSPLALFESLELLSLGILGKAALWIALSTVIDAIPQVSGLDLDHLERRAADQHARVEHQRLIAAPLALV